MRHVKSAEVSSDMKSLEQFRLRRQAVYESLFSASSLCIAGLLVMPALLFNNNTLLRAVQFLGFWFLCWLAGKKNKPLMTILVILVIVGFNLIVPYGQVLFTLGSFRVSSGALMTGIQRAVTLQGLIMLSRLSIRQDLKIPGGFGDLVAESFRFFALIVNSKHKISRKNLMEDIDRLMLELSEERQSSPLQEIKAPQSRTPGLIILIALGILFWLPLFIVNN